MFTNKLSFIPIIVCMLDQFSVGSASGPGDELNFVNLEGELRSALEERGIPSKEINPTVEYLQSLSSADAAALIEFDRKTKAVAAGIGNNVFRWVVATVVPDGFAKMNLTPASMDEFTVGMKEFLRVGECAYGGDCDRIRRVIGRTNFGMAAFWKYILASSTTETDRMDRFIRYFHEHSDRGNRIGEGILDPVRTYLHDLPLEVLMGWVQGSRTQFAHSRSGVDAGTYIFAHVWSRLRAVTAGPVQASVAYAVPHLP